MHSLKLIALLLDYPDTELYREAAALSEAAGTAVDLSTTQRTELQGFIEQLTDIPLLEAQANYVGWFDRGRSLSLLLFEHVHGESRDRGQAMVDLMNIYNTNGYEIDARELPDYLPLFLEYLSLRPAAESKQWLLDVSHILALLEARLIERDCLYSQLFTLLLVLCDANIDKQPLKEKVATEEPDYSHEALDKVWEEEMVRFGADANCDQNTVAARREELNKVQPLQFVEPTSQACK